MRLVSQETQKIIVVEAEEGDLEPEDARHFAENLLETQGQKLGWWYAGFEQQNYNRVKVLFASEDCR